MIAAVRVCACVRVRVCSLTEVGRFVTHIQVRKMEVHEESVISEGKSVIEG